MTNYSTTPAYTRYHWAKSDRANPDRIHLLEHHLADVGACFESLLRQPTIGQRLACAGGLEELHPTMAARLCVFAALHDIGKVNMGFQTLIWREADIPPGQRRPVKAGHIQGMVPVLNENGDTETAKWFCSVLKFDELLGWDDSSGSAAALFVAALSHHGSPLNLSENISSNSRAWRSFASLDPRECVERIGKLVRQWFDDAFAPDAQPLPSAPEFQHHFLGLCTLADWIGSNEAWFPYIDRPDDNYMDRARRQAEKAVKDIGLDIGKQRRVFAAMPLRRNFSDLFDHPEPNAIQRQTALETPLTEPLVIIESETGSGKTEAALWRFAWMYEAQLVDGLYFALPTRSAANQIHERVERFVNKLFPEGLRPDVILAVPGYNPEDYAPEAVALPKYDEQAAHRHEHGEEKPWASESSKRYLAAQIAVGTVDQAMLGALQVRHAHLRSSCLARNLLVVDEVHASDTYMTEIIRALLAAHTGAGGYALLMSATLGSTAQEKWLRPGQRRADGQGPSLEKAKARPYPAVSIASNPEPISAGDNDQAKTVTIVPTPAMSDFAQTAHFALAAARQGAKVLVMRNTVDYAVRTQQAVEASATDADWPLLFTANGCHTLHHGRFARSDRRLLDGLVEERLGKEREPGGCIVVGTQTLEQSLDIDADLLITDLCPVDVLLQRIGRLHRHVREDRPAGCTGARCVVLTPGDDLTPYLTRKTDCNGLGPNGYVYRSLHVLEATRRLVHEYPVWRIPEMNRELVERATHPEALDEITRELGDEWKSHAINNAGGYIADRQQAHGNALKFDKSFLEDNRAILFPSRAEENIRTRLGDDRVEITFGPQPSSPFDPARTIERLDLPLRWLQGAEVPERVSPTAVEPGFEFSVGIERFRYDRLGLGRG